MEIKGKKVLLVGLGILGGGVATARWLFEKGAVLTITDMKDEVALKNSLDQLSDITEHVTFVLGKHDDADFLNNDIIVLNPDVPFKSKFVELARNAGKQIENELTLFARFTPQPISVAVTGTRGKTTTVNWIHHFLKAMNPKALLLGNDPKRPFLQEISRIEKGTPTVLEVPSFQLELVNKDNFHTNVAVITNLFQDHLNRHGTMEEYARTKGNLFAGQKARDTLVLNKGNNWTDFFLSLKPAAHVIFSDDDKILTQDELLQFVKKWGPHNLENLLTAAAAAYAAGVSLSQIRSSIPTLPQIKFREECVYESDTLSIFNDTTATSPEATIAAVARFSSSEDDFILIAGGTDRNLEYGAWAKKLQHSITPSQLVLLSGSATEKMKVALGWDFYQEYDSLLECVEQAITLSQCSKKKHTNVLFSPGAKSFEKFKNEFDRGEKFNEVIGKVFEKAQ